MRAFLRSPATKVAYVLALIVLAVVVGRKLVDPGEPPPIEIDWQGATVRQLLRGRAGWRGTGLPPGDVEDPLWRYYLTEDVAALFFYTRRAGEQYDPWCYITHAPNMDLKRPWKEHPLGGWNLVTNSLGMRRKHDPEPERPDLRILATGDSHTDGVCWNHEAWPMVLERQLSDGHADLAIEGLNTGKGGYSFYNYLGVLEKHLALQPHAFVVCIYGGNDFEECLSLAHYFARTVRPGGKSEYPQAIKRGQRVSGPALAQCFLSYKYFQHEPEQIPVALETARVLCGEIVERCRAEGVLPIFVYLPALPEVRFEDETEVCSELMKVLRLKPADLEVHERFADALLEHLAEQGVDTIDMRTPYRESAEFLYWHHDFHINVAGHRLIAEALAPLLEERFLSQDG